MKRYDFVIIGEGIAGLYSAFLLSRTFPQKNIALVADSKSFPACSFRTTGVVSKSGISRDVSPLGNLLLDAHECFSQHMQKDSPDGVYAGTRYHLSTDGCGPFVKRWPEHEFREMPFLRGKMYVAIEKCFLIDPHEYLGFLKSNSKVDFLEDEIVEIQQHQVIGRKLILNAENILVMNGAFQRKRPIKLSLRPQDEFYLSNNRIVPGRFALFQLINLGDANFVISHGHNNLIYRAWSGEVLIGGTTNKNESEDDSGELAEMIEFYRNICSFDIPGPVHVDTGLRLKGMKREPRMIEVNSYTHALWGTYKNGWSLPHYFLQEYVGKLLNA